MCGLNSVYAIDSVYVCVHVCVWELRLWNEFIFVSKCEQKHENMVIVRFTAGCSYGTTFSVHQDHIYYFLMHISLWINLSICIMYVWTEQCACEYD